MLSGSGWTPGPVPLSWRGKLVGMSIALQWAEGGSVLALEGKRERLVDILDRTGVLRGVMQLRRLSPLPIVGIFTFHHIHDVAEDASYPYDPEVADATPQQFRRHLEALLRIGTPITMAELLRGLGGATLPANPLMITFDDGYRSCHDVALPILRRLGVPA